MIKAFILYFLGIKPTHGYEIQKYIELNKMNEWTKIQSGSIYYALAKLEKDKFIQLERTEIVKNKERKIYKITDLGQKELDSLLLDEMNKPIYSEKSDKFVAYPFICGIDKDSLTSAINTHILALKSKKATIANWQEIKINKNSLGIERISFEMMISSIDYQIKWHRALIDELDKYIGQSHVISNLINQIDFADINSTDELYDIVGKDFGGKG